MANDQTNKVAEYHFNLIKHTEPAKVGEFSLMWQRVLLPQEYTEILDKDNPQRRDYGQPTKHKNHNPQIQGVIDDPRDGKPVNWYAMQVRGTPVITYLK